MDAQANKIYSFRPFRHLWVPFLFTAILMAAFFFGTLLTFTRNVTAGLWMLLGLLGGCCIPVHFGRLLFFRIDIADGDLRLYYGRALKLTEQLDDYDSAGIVQVQNQLYAHITPDRFSVVYVCFSNGYVPKRFLLPPFFAHFRRTHPCKSYLILPCKKQDIALFSAAIDKSSAIMIATSEHL